MTSAGPSEQPSPKPPADRGPRRTGARIAGALAAVVLVAGIIYVSMQLDVSPAPAGPPSSPPTASTTPEPDRDELPYVTYVATTAFGIGDGALFEGDLVRLEGGCLVVVSDTDLTIPMFPEQYTTWDSATGRLTVDGTTLNVGDRVGFGGGYHDNPMAGSSVPTACTLLEAPFFVVSSLVGPDLLETLLPPSTDVIAAARTLPSAPEAVRADAGRLNCGEFVLDQTKEVPSEALACLTDHLGTDVELAFSRPTTEGDPIVYFVIGVAQQRQPAGADRSLDVFRTSHWDKFAGTDDRDSWWRTTCQASVLDDADSFLQCVHGDFERLPA